MAKLSTPYHQCTTVIVDGQGAPLRHCPRPAYRRWGGEWYCRSCTLRKQSTVWMKHAG